METKLERSHSDVAPSPEYIEGLAANFELTSFAKSMRFLGVDETYISSFGELLKPVALAIQLYDEFVILQIKEIPPGSGYALFTIVREPPRPSYDSSAWLTSSFWEELATQGTTKLIREDSK